MVDVLYDTFGVTVSDVAVESMTSHAASLLTVAILGVCAISVCLMLVLVRLVRR